MRRESDGVQVLKGIARGAEGVTRPLSEGRIVYSGGSAAEAVPTPGASAELSDAAAFFVAGIIGELLEAGVAVAILVFDGGVATGAPVDGVDEVDGAGTVRGVG